MSGFRWSLDIEFAIQLCVVAQKELIDLIFDLLHSVCYLLGFSRIDRNMCNKFYPNARRDFHEWNNGLS
jgi:hypothetical protein